MYPKCPKNWVTGFPRFINHIHLSSSNFKLWRGFPKPHHNFLALQLIQQWLIIVPGSTGFSLEGLTVFFIKRFDGFFLRRSDGFFVWRFNGFFFRRSDGFFSPPSLSKEPIVPHLINLVHVLVGDGFHELRPDKHPQTRRIHQSLMLFNVSLSRFLPGIKTW